MFVFKRIQAKGFFSLLIAFAFFITSCKNESLEKQIHSLDSLNGALNQKLQELKSTDTVTLRKALARYNDYKKFVHQNLSDTVSKEEADILQQFYKSGENLLSFEDNRRAIMARGSLISSQLNKLVADAKSNAGEGFETYFDQERRQTETLINQSVEQQRLFLENLQAFRLSLNGVETLIKSRNSGQMPVVIRDTVPF